MSLLSSSPQLMQFTTCMQCRIIQAPPWEATTQPTVGTPRQESGTRSMTPGTDLYLSVRDGKFLSTPSLWICSTFLIKPMPLTIIQALPELFAKTFHCLSPSDAAYQVRMCTVYSLIICNSKNKHALKLKRRHRLVWPCAVCILQHLCACMRPQFRSLLSFALSRTLLTLLCCDSKKEKPQMNNLWNWGFDRDNLWGDMFQPAGCIGVDSNGFLKALVSQIPWLLMPCHVIMVL